MYITENELDFLEHLFSFFEISYEAFLNEVFFQNDIQKIELQIKRLKRLRFLRENIIDNLTTKQFLIASNDLIFEYRKVIKSLNEFHLSSISSSKRDMTYKILNKINVKLNSKIMDFDNTASRHKNIGNILEAVHFEDITNNAKEILFRYEDEINKIFNPEKNVEFQTISDDTKEKKSIIKTYNIDNNIPLTTNQSENTYALIIGNEDYSTHQRDLSREVNVNYATNDAEVFKKYCTKTLGIPERHINFLKDATAGQMKQGLAWIKNLAKVTTGKANLIFYYAGHGLPDEITKTSYLMPVDVSGSYINLGISLNEVINSVSQYPTNKSVIFLDACFSGGARNKGLVAMRGVKIKPKEEKILGNLVVFSSSSGNESSGSYEDKKHGMFTYFLLKKLQESKGSANLKQLSDYVYNSVRKESALSGKIQTPQVQYSSSIGKEWEGWTLLE